MYQMKWYWGLAGALRFNPFSQEVNMHTFLSNDICNILETPSLIDL